jgi:hypothetical protein
MPEDVLGTVTVEIADTRDLRVAGVSTEIDAASPLAVVMFGSMLMRMTTCPYAFSPRSICSRPD